MEHIKLLNLSVEILRDENNKLSNNNTELTKLVEKNQEDIQKLTKKFDTLKQNLRKNDNDDTEMKNEIVELRGKIEILKNELNKNSNADLEEDVKEVKEQIEQLRNDFEKLNYVELKKKLERLQFNV